MNDERKRIARQYVQDMVGSFVTEREAEGLTMTSIYAPDLERLLEIACDCDNYATKVVWDWRLLRENFWPKFFTPLGHNSPGDPKIFAQKSQK